MADSILLEHRNIPAAAICVVNFAKTTGRVTAKIMGWPDYPLVCIPYGVVEAKNEDEINNTAEIAGPQVENVLLGINIRPYMLDNQDQLI